MRAHAERGHDQGPTARQLMIVPTLCVGMPPWTLCVRLCDAERHGMRAHAERGNDRGPTARQLMIVPTLRVGMPRWTLRVRSCDAERHGMHSHAERGNDRHHANLLFRLCMTAALFSR